ncbi:MAG: hypothetical protein ACRCZS_15970 [Chroococcidiopsis sp.]
MMTQNPWSTAFTRQSADKKEKVGFAAIALDQIDKISEFGKGLTAYWLRCWRVDCFGNVFVPLQEDIGNTTKAKYRKILQQLGFFMFEIRQFGKQRTLWVRNLCAPKSGSFRYPTSYKPQTIDKSVDSIEQSLETKLPLLETGGQEKVESISVQGFQKPSVFTQDNLNKNTTNKEDVVASNKLEEQEAIATPCTTVLAENSNIEQVEQVTVKDDNCAERLELVENAGIKLNATIEKIVLQHTLEQVQKAIAYYRDVVKESGRRKKPEGWLTDCLRGEWWKDGTVSGDSNEVELFNQWRKSSPQHRYITSTRDIAITGLEPGQIGVLVDEGWVNWRDLSKNYDQ